MVSHEQAVLEAEGIEGLVLRYGWFYGPATYYASDGSIAQMVRKRRFPVLGGSDGLFSFIHIEDAAGATVTACERGDAGHLQHRRRRAGDDRASGCRRTPRRSARSGRGRCPGFIGRLLGGTAARMTIGLRGRVEREGEARAGLGAALPELARGISRGSWIG